MTSASSQYASASGTGTGVGPSAAMMRCSRPMSCAVGSTPCNGGRRTTSSRPAASRTRAVMFDCPPTMTSAVNGGVVSGSAVDAQREKDSRSIPVGASLTASAP